MESYCVGDTMTGLDIEFGRDRVIDTPVSSVVLRPCSRRSGNRKKGDSCSPAYGFCVICYGSYCKSGSQMEIYVLRLPIL